MVPEADARRSGRAAAFDVERVAELERVTRHDVAAFVQGVAESVGPAGRWVHFGLTSSDVLDTGLAIQLRAAADLLLKGSSGSSASTKSLALAHRDTVMAGRTHGVLAEPTSFGHKAALWAFELDRDRERLRRARRRETWARSAAPSGRTPRSTPGWRRRSAPGSAFDPPRPRTRSWRATATPS